MKEAFANGAGKPFRGIQRKEENSGLSLMAAVGANINFGIRSHTGEGREKTSADVCHFKSHDADPGEACMEIQFQTCG